MLEQAGAAGTLTTGAHFAARAIEHQGELRSTDADMQAFSGLRWRNPLGQGLSSRSPPTLPHPEQPRT